MPSGSSLVLISILLSVVLIAFPEIESVIIFSSAPPFLEILIIGNSWSDIVARELIEAMAFPKLLFDATISDHEFPIIKISRKGGAEEKIITDSISGNAIKTTDKSIEINTKELPEGIREYLINYLFKNISPAAKGAVGQYVAANQAQSTLSIGSIPSFSGSTLTGGEALKASGSIPGATDAIARETSALKARGVSNALSKVQLTVPASKGRIPSFAYNGPVVTNTVDEGSVSPVNYESKIKKVHGFGRSDSRFAKQGASKGYVPSFAAVPNFIFGLGSKEDGVSKFINEYNSRKDTPRENDLRKALQERIKTGKKISGFLTERDIINRLPQDYIDEISDTKNKKKGAKLNITLSQAINSALSYAEKQRKERADRPSPKDKLRGAASKVAGLPGVNLVPKLGGMLRKFGEDPSLGLFRTIKDRISKNRKPGESGRAESRSKLLKFRMPDLSKLDLADKTQKAVAALGKLIPKLDLAKLVPEFGPSPKLFDKIASPVRMMADLVPGLSNIPILKKLIPQDNSGFRQNINNQINDRINNLGIQADSDLGAHLKDNVGRKLTRKHLLRNASQIAAGEITGTEDKRSSIDKSLQKEIHKTLKTKQRDSRGKFVRSDRANAFYNKFDSNIDSRLTEILRGDSTTHSSKGLKEKVTAFLTGTSDRQIQKKQAIFGAVGEDGKDELLERFKQRLREKAFDSVKRGEFNPDDIKEWIKNKINIHSVASTYDRTKERKDQKKSKRNQVPSNIIFINEF